MRYIYIIIILVVILVAGGVLFYNNSKIAQPIHSPSASSGVPLPTPMVSTHPEASPSAVTILEPKAGSLVRSPFTIKGQAPGSWLFEGQTTASLQRQDGTEIAQAVLLAETEWMTVEQVTFSGSMKYTKPEGVTDVNLVIRKENPSGLPENDDSFVIPIKLTE